MANDTGNPTLAMKSLEAFTAAIDKASAVAGTFITSSIGMAKSAASGAAGLDAMGANVSTVASEFGFLGKAFGATFTAAIAVLEKNISTQQSLSVAGATFGGDLIRLRETVNKTYLNMDDFSKVVGNNTGILASFRGGVQQGTEFFANSMRSLMSVGNATGKMMANLGVSANEAAELTMQTMRMQGSMNKSTQMTTDELAVATANYAAELTALSDLTGTSRKALAEKAAEEMAEAQWQNFLAQLDSGEAEKLQKAATAELAIGGKSAAESFKAMAAGFPPLTKGSQLLASTQSAVIERQQEMVKIARDSNVDAKNVLPLYAKTIADSLPGLREGLGSIAPVLLAQAISGQTELTKANEMSARFSTVNRNKSPEDIQASILAKISDSLKPGTEAVTGVGYQQQAIDSANAVLKAATSAFSAALAKGMEFGNFLNNSVALPIMNAIGGALNSRTFAKLQEAISQQVKNVIDTINGVDVYSKIDENMRTALDTATNPKKISGEKLPALGGAITGGMLDAISQLVKVIADIGTMALALVTGDLKTVKNIWEKATIPDFFGLLKVWSERVEQITGILNRPGNSSKLNNPPAPPQQNPAAFTPPDRPDVRSVNASYRQPIVDALTPQSTTQQVAYNEENTGEGAVDVNKLVNEIMPLLRALVDNTGATERAIKNAPARFSNASYT